MRYEYKYYVPNFRLEQLRVMISPFVKSDKFAAKQAAGEYTVRSIYFDSPSFEMYHTKLEHLAHRMKVRMRAYNTEHDHNPVFLEIKRKYEGPILKNRATLQYDVVKRIFAGEAIDDFLPSTNKTDNVRRFFYQMYSRQLQPVVNVIYEREPYLSKVFDPENDLRITLDKNLRSVAYPNIHELFVERDLQYPLDEQFILEVKFNNYCPAWMKPILANMDLQRGPASKYVHCIDCQPTIKTHRKGSAFFHQ